MPPIQKKVLYVITKSNFGGAQRYVYELATGLPHTYESVVACGGNGILVEKLASKGVRTYPVRSFERDINILRELQSLRELWHIFRTEKPDIVHLNSSKAGGSGALIARLCGVPHIVFTAHGWPFFEKRSLLARATIWALSYLTVILAHRTIVVSAHDQKRTYMPGVSHKIICIHTAVPAIAFYDRTTAREKLFPEDIRTAHASDLWVVSTGEHTRNKNLRRLLDAVAHANTSSSRKIFLTLIGDGEERTELEAHANALGLKSSVYFTGFVDDARLYLKAFEVFTLPSLKEGFPYGLLEAGAARLGCIASNVGGIPEILCAPEYGTLIDPYETQTLTRALLRYAEDTHLAEMHGEALAKRIGNTFNLARMTEQTMALYESKNSRAV